jgi:hypothetical protein
VLGGIVNFADVETNDDTDGELVIDADEDDDFEDRDEGVVEALLLPKLVALAQRVTFAETDEMKVEALVADTAGESVVADDAVSRAVGIEVALVLIDGRVLVERGALVVREGEAVELQESPALANAA